MTTEQEQYLQEITRTVEDFARARGYVFSTAKGRILQELVRIRQQFGRFYCPCQHESTDDTVCVCAEVRAGYVDEMGKCHCNLFRQASLKGPIL